MAIGFTIVGYGLLEIGVTPRSFLFRPSTETFWPIHDDHVTIDFWMFLLHPRPFEEFVMWERLPFYRLRTVSKLLLKRPLNPPYMSIGWRYGEVCVRIILVATFQSFDGCLSATVMVVGKKLPCDSNALYTQFIIEAHWHTNKQTLFGTAHFRPFTSTFSVVIAFNARPPMQIYTFIFLMTCMDSVNTFKSRMLILVISHVSFMSKKTLSDIPSVSCSILRKRSFAMMLVILGIRLPRWHWCAIRVSLTEFEYLQYWSLHFSNSSGIPIPCFRVRTFSLGSL